ncbi:unnamed protein product [Thlaspi arvense]|uniref:Protein kinase domain-containing protein n=1 Tax=Thlaspi arvense TaxID=13288 RepID=A0AAU9S1T5_THLAR|nr:unnamed protein product [Thlaspi arvense]
MAREILILRKLNHPNIMKREGIITSRTSSSIYLVFEYMEHDLAGLSSNPDIRFTESQVQTDTKLVLVVYASLEDAQPRMVMPLWKAKLEEPKQDQSNASLMIVDNSTSQRCRRARRRREALGSSR